MIQHHLPDAWSAETAGAPYPVPSCRAATRGRGRADLTGTTNTTANRANR
jgi:hypothetical protein